MRKVHMLPKRRRPLRASPSTPRPAPAARDDQNLRVLTSEILRALEQELGASQAQMARRLGIPATTYGRFHSDAKRGADLRSLTQLLVGLDMNPLEFFSRHPRLSGLAGAQRAPELKELHYARLRALLSASQVEALVTALAGFERAGLLGAVLTAAQRIGERLVGARPVAQPIAGGDGKRRPPGQPNPG